MSEEKVTQRVSGFYWVRRPKGQWMVCSWHSEHGGGWFVPGRIDAYHDSIFDDIHESRLFPPVEQSGDGTHPNQWGPME